MPQNDPFCPLFPSSKSLIYISNFPSYAPEFPADRSAVYREFALRPEVSRAAEKCFQFLRKKEVQYDRNLTFVGIHNRRTDYEGIFKFLSPEFFKVPFFQQFKG